VAGIRYIAFVDPSGGSQDAMTLAIAHAEGEVMVLDAVREVRPPFSPEAVVSEFAGLLATYGITTVTGDRYSGEWPREVFRRAGITYQPSARTKSEIYGELLPLLNSGKVELLDNARLLAQLQALERRTSRSGRDSIDHGPGGHDDVVNAAGGALVLAASGVGTVDFLAGLVVGPPLLMADPHPWPSLVENPHPTPTLPGGERAPLQVPGYRSPFDGPDPDPWHDW
jgi:hypothetical protein